MAKAEFTKKEPKEETFDVEYLTKKQVLAGAGVASKWLLEVLKVIGKNPQIGLSLDGKTVIELDPEDFVKQLLGFLNYAVSEKNEPFTVRLYKLCSNTD